MTDSYNVEYLKCDALGCDHTEFVGLVEGEHIGKPCPKCGASLLTEEDYVACIEVREKIKFLVELGILGNPNGEPTPGTPMVDINPHDGKLNLSFYTKN